MSKKEINGVGEIATLLAEVANPELKLPSETQQYILEVFMVLTHDIALLNLEWDKELLRARYAEIKSGLLELQESVLALLDRVHPGRRQFVESIERELEEMLSLLELTRKVCLK